MRNLLILTLPLFLLFALTGCDSGCDANEATNKMLALNSMQARLVAKGGEGLDKFASAFAIESAPISELIAQQRYGEACKMADGLATKYKLDLKKEMAGMITVEQLAKDGGKGAGNCSVADAAKKQMELHTLIQTAVNAGKKDNSLFQRFNEDSKGYGEMLATDPSKACALFDKLKAKYEL